MTRKSDFINRLFVPPEQSYFLFGPRGTGKSSFLAGYYPDALVLDLLNPKNVRSFSARPESFTDWLESHPGHETIVIDEVQKVPELLAVVHSLMESRRYKNQRFVLTGSSSRKLKRAGVDLLGGRALKRFLHPFLACELGAKFSFKSSLREGLLPIVWSAKVPQDVLGTYIDLYMREEVQMEGLVRDIAPFSRFLEAVSFSHGSVINVSEISREAEVERKSVERFIDILQDLLLAHRLPIFSKRAKRELIGHDKFYFFDSGVFQALRPMGPLDAQTEIDGLALEGFIFQHLLGWLDYRGRKNKLFFWRTVSQVEVDFILYGEDGLFAIEVKNNLKIRSKDLRGLLSFGEDYPEAQLICLFRGNQRELHHKKIQCVPVDEFLKQLHPHRNISTILK